MEQVGLGLQESAKVVTAITTADRMGSNDYGKWGNRSTLALNQGVLLHNFPTYSNLSTQTSVQNFGSLNSALNPGLLWALNKTLPIGGPWWMCPEGSIGLRQAGGLAALTGYPMWNHLPVI